MEMLMLDQQKLICLDACLVRFSDLLNDDNDFKTNQNDHWFIWR